MNKPSFTPWYHEPWAWYMVAMLMVTFTWGAVQVYTAFTHQDSVVIDDYYQNGRTINQDMTRSDNAKAMAIVATVTIDDLTGEVRVVLAGKTEQWPPQLTLSFLSPVFQDRDHTIDLSRTHYPASGTAYTGQLSQIISGRYYLQLATADTPIPEVGHDFGWKITREVNVTPGSTITLNTTDQG